MFGRLVTKKIRNSNDLFLPYSGLHQVNSLADQMSTTFKCMDITAAGAKKCAEVTGSAVKRFRSDAGFSSFWEKIV